jgi:hypothetical protein
MFADASGTSETSAVMLARTFKYSGSDNPILAFHKSAEEMFSLIWFAICGMFPFSILPGRVDRLSYLLYNHADAKA